MHKQTQESISFFQLTKLTRFVSHTSISKAQELKLWGRSLAAAQRLWPGPARPGPARAGNRAQAPA